MQGHKESGNSSQTENLRKANRLSIHQTLRETIYSSTTENESIQLQEELTQEKITLQSKEGVRKLEQPKPKESIHSLVKKFSQLFHDKKQQTLYNLLALVKMVPHIKISKTIKWFSAQGISWLFDLVREEEYQGKALWLLMNNQEEESHYSIWMENDAVKLFLQLLKSQNFEIIQLSLEGLLRLTKCKLDFCNQFIIYQGVQRISKLIHNFHQKEIKQMDIFNKSYQLLAKICEYSEKFEADTTRQILREFFFGFYQQILPDDNVYNCYRAIAKNLKPSDNEIIQGVPDFKGIIFNNLLYVGEQQLQIVKTMFESQVPFAKEFSFLPLIQLVKPSLYHNSQRWLDSENETQKMAASVLFYMTNGSPQQLHELLSDKEFIPKMLQKKIFQRRSTYGNTTVREFFQTFIIKCEPQLIYRYYTHHHVIQMLFGILYMNKQNLVKTALLMLQDILQYDEKYRPNILEILEIPQISSFASQFKYVFAQGQQYLPQVFKQRIDELRNSNTPNGALFNKLINRYIQLIDDPLL